MPAKQGTSTVLGKLGDRLRKIHETHKTDETKYGAGGDLPEGIENGVAQLIDMKLGQYKEGTKRAGEWFVHGRGMVIEPLEINGIRVAGLHTSFTEPLCDTPDAGGKKKTLDDHYAWVLNELRKLGLDTTTMGVDDLEPTMQALVQSAPYFRFRTYKLPKQTTGPYKDAEPMVFEEWRGIKGLESYVPPDSSAAVQDATAAGNGEAPADPADVLLPENDLDALVIKATEQDATAIARLTEMAVKAGMTEKDVENADSWEAVSQTIRGGDTGAAEGEDDWAALGEAADNGDDGAVAKLSEALRSSGLDPDAMTDLSWAEAAAQLIETLGGSSNSGGFVPAVKDIMLYKPMDIKTKQPVKKAIECEVVLVDMVAKTCDLKNMDNKKLVYNSIKWDALEKGA